ncbi:2-oxoglutarate dehydrogenase E1 component [soil metagenome]
MSTSLLARPNADLLDAKYAQWRRDPRAVEATWSAFFEGFELGSAQLKQRRNGGALKVADGAERPGTGVLTEDELSLRARTVSLVYLYRSLGHTAAWIDPLAPGPPEKCQLARDLPTFTEAELDREVATAFYQGGRPMKLRRLLELLQSTYCDRIGFEFMYIQNVEVRNWLRDRIETRVETDDLDAFTKERVLKWLVEAEAFEQFLHKKYIGQKRFSLEGGESLMVALHAILERCPDLGVEEIVMGMAHRGRLNVLANFLKKPLRVLFYEFNENYVPDLVAGDGDVKYHLGFHTSRVSETGQEVKIFLAANPSHLEAVDPVVEGQARARQRIIGDSVGRSRVLPLLIHGDAAFAGQGMVAEVLNLSQLPGYRTGGTVHVIVNNQIGFTTQPEDARSSHYCTDVAKMIEAPVIHVNGDHPLEVMYAAELAAEFRDKFARDVVLDIVCYRRHGHNEGDEPSFTQPKVSRQIDAKDTVTTLFRKRLLEKGDLSQAEADEVVKRSDERLEGEFTELQEAQEAGDMPSAAAEGTSSTHQPEFSFEPVDTGVEASRIRWLGIKITEFPEGFQINQKVKRTVLDKRREAAENGGPFNWANAEALAFASLLTEGHPVRLSGQDSRRGTFSQRHSVLYDRETRERYFPLNHLTDDQARYCAYNSLLSEAAVLGFDYGYSLMAPEMLALWEAQFGDFSNGAQVIIDQFISSAESKWSKASGITLLLPHGYEGQGPEHSSARLERFLQLCAERNMQVVNLTTPAQYFHVLRRQLKRPFRKPLVIMTPKSLLRHKDAVSYVKEMDIGTSFCEMLDDDQLIDKQNRVTRLVFCSGKVYYDLLAYRNEHQLKNVAIIRVEQIYPLHTELLEEIVSRYPRANKKWVWCQEEPLNMGAWSFIGWRLQKLNPGGRVRYAGRERAASPATGAKAVHLREQKGLVERAFNV